MRTIITTTRFERVLVRFVRRHPHLKSDIQKTIQRIARRDVTVRSHALHGQLKGYRAATVSQQYRLVFALDSDTATFINIGSHDEVY